MLSRRPCVRTPVHAISDTPDQIRRLITSLSSSADGSRYETQGVPKFKIPSQGTSPSVAYQLVHDETALDGNPSLNLASFVHTWMPEEANKLMQENVGKNLVRCVS